MRIPFGRWAFAALFVAVAGFAAVTLRGPRGLPALRDINRQIAAKETDNFRLAREVERMRDRIRRLKENPAEQELEIRKRLKLMQKGERVYIVPESKD